MKSSMTVKFWGVRGSIPSPGPSTVRYGGTTPCVSIDLGADKTLVLDAGTGIRELGKALVGGASDIFVLVTHIHWDHIQGFPYFSPIYQPNRIIYTFPTLQGKIVFHSLIEQMDGAHFPVSPDNLPSQCRYITEDAVLFLCNHGFSLSRIATNHPGGCHGYRIENADRSVVYLTDNELDPPYEKATDIVEFVQFCKHADVLIHDAQYLEQDMPHRRGWGHSLVSQACELAAAAEVKHLILYHHDPDRTDDELDSLQADARAWFQRNNHTIQCTAAFEGLTLDI